MRLRAFFNACAMLATTVLVMVLSEPVTLNTLIKEMATSREFFEAVGRPPKKAMLPLAMRDHRYHFAACADKVDGGYTRRSDTSNRKIVYRDVIEVLQACDATREDGTLPFFLEDGTLNGENPAAVGPGRFLAEGRPFDCRPSFVMARTVVAGVTYWRFRGQQLSTLFGYAMHRGFFSHKSTHSVFAPSVAKALPEGWIHVRSDQDYREDKQAGSTWLSKEAILFLYVAGPLVEVKAKGARLSIPKSQFTSLSNRIKKVVAKGEVRSRLWQDLEAVVD